MDEAICARSLSIVDVRRVEITRREFVEAVADFVFKSELVLKNCRGITFGVVGSGGSFVC